MLLAICKAILLDLSLLWDFPPRQLYGLTTWLGVLCVLYGASLWLCTNLCLCPAFPGAALDLATQVVGGTMSSVNSSD